jgi:hypothetical protein
MKICHPKDFSFDSRIKHKTLTLFYDSLHYDAATVPSIGDLPEKEHRITNINYPEKEHRITNINYPEKAG